MGPPLLLAGSIGVAIVSVLAVLRRRRGARATAERWLAAQRYRVRELRVPWIGAPVFPATGMRDSEYAVDFRAVVDDLKLGGTGVVWLRVWPAWTGKTRDEPDIWWEQMPDMASAGPAPQGASWESAQLAILSRVASGETTFRPDSPHTPEATARFDLLVEHLQAMQRRGLLTMSAPIAELSRPGQMYGAVTNVALTDEGRRIAARTSPT